MAALASQVHPSAQHSEVQPSQIHVTLSLVSIPEPVYLSDSVAQSLEIEALNSSIEALQLDSAYHDEQMLVLKARLLDLEATCKAQYEEFNRQIEEMKALFVKLRSHIDALEGRQQHAGKAK